MARRAPSSGQDVHDGVIEGTLSRMRAPPSYRTVTGQFVHGPEGIRPGFSAADDPTVPSMAAPPSYETMVQNPAEGGDIPRGMWPPSSVVKEDRGKAIAVWVLLLSAFIAYVVYLSVNSVEMRGNPPVQIVRKEEPFTLPDVVFCPSAGDGCDTSDGSDCLPMNWFLSSIEGLSADCDKYYATPSPVAPTPVPMPVAPTPVPTRAPFNENAGAGNPAAGTPAPGRTTSSESSVLDATPSPVVIPAIRFDVNTTAHEWCPRIPLSECGVDDEGVRSGTVRSLHASFYVLWNDTAASSDPLTSTRRFINMFFIDQDMDVTDAVVAVRLPYDRVIITGTDPFTFSSNDVILSMSQYVPLGSDGKPGLVERTYTQATTTAQHTLRLDNFEGEEYEGALLYVTLSVNNFAYQSIEEVDPVDWWALLGSAGGVWEIICVMFGACFIARQAVGPDKKWGWAKAAGKGGGGRCSRSSIISCGCCRCLKCSGCKA